MSKKTGEYSSPIGPGTEAIGQPSAFAAGVVNASGEPSPHTTPVMKQSSKNSAGDPSQGTATYRVASLERNGAKFRVNPISNYAAPNHPSSGATQANGRVITTRPAVIQDGVDYPAGTNEAFSDAEEVAGRAPGSSRLEGWAGHGR